MKQETIEEAAERLYPRQKPNSYYGNIELLQQEAFEEGAQFTIGTATNDYYNKKEKGDDISFLDILTSAIGNTIGTTEGMENILIGGLSGAIMQGKGKYSESVEKNLNTQKALKLFNESSLSNFTKETTDSVSRGVVLQEEREKKLSEGDVFGSKDSEMDYIINYLTPRIKYGRMDLVQSDIDEYRFLAFHQNQSLCIRQTKVS